MVDYRKFTDVFEFIELSPDLSYGEENLLQIIANKNALGGLFVERVMKILGIRRPSKFYPPKCNSDLRELHRAIIETTSTDHHKLSVLFYVLLDFGHCTRKSKFINVLEQKSLLPRAYQTFMRGLWYMDRLEFKLALQFLTDPSLIPSFPDEIMEALVRATNNPSLPLAYYHTVQPGLITRQGIESLFTAIAGRSVSEAFYFSRAQNEYTQRLCFEKLISLVLRNPYNHNIANRSVELINLPLTPQEETWFEQYLLQGEGKTLKGALDTLMMRRLGTGNFSGFLSLKAPNDRTSDGLDWGLISNAVKSGMGPRSDS
ncbi:hypothetical protein K3495_g8970 [Podosphaera aphanis]|nr:hypothetical protein K3495_g8970 [Podosphaera aphanis]